MDNKMGRLEKEGKERKEKLTSKKVLIFLTGQGPQSCFLRVAEIRKNICLQASATLTGSRESWKGGMT